MGKAKPRSSLESTKPSEKWPKAKPTEATARSQHFDETQFSNRLLISGLHALTHVSYEISSFDRFSRICTALRFAILPAESSLRAVASLLSSNPWSSQLASLFAIPISRRQGCSTRLPLQGTKIRLCFRKSAVLAWQCACLRLTRARASAGFSF